MPETPEVWRSYLGDYAVSTRGRVKYVPSGRIRKLQISSRGYATFTMFLNGRSCPMLVHRAVLECFVGPPPEGAVGRHLNGKPLDNRLENLAWGTQSQNVRDAIAHGTHASGENSPRAKLSKVTVRAIRSSSESGPVLAERYGVSRSLIARVRKRKAWMHV